MSFLCVLWETCFTSSRRFSTCRKSSGGRVTAQARARSAEVGSSVWMIVGGESGPCAAGTSIAGEAAAKAGELGEGAMADSGALCEPRSQMTATSPENS